MTATRPIDLEHLARYTANDAALQAEIFALFREQTELWSRLLDPTSDDESWSAAAHALKGTARGVGAFRLGDACEAAEALVGADASPVRRSVAAADVRDALHQALEFIDALDHRSASAPLRKASQASNS